MAFHFALFAWSIQILVDKVIFSYLSLFIDGYLFLFFGVLAPLNSPDYLSGVNEKQKKK